MKVYPNKLKAQFQQSVKPVYVVSGDEPLLVQESCDLIRESLKQRGFTERELFHIDTGFDWSRVLFSANSMSLFAEKKILELRIPNGKPGDKGARALQTFAQTPPEGTTLLLVLPKMDPASQRSKWFTALDELGVSVQIWPVDVNQLPRWISERFRSVGLQASRDAVTALIDRIEGNLLAAVQEIERLRLISNDNRIDVDQVLEGVSNNARYDVFGLIDAAVGQDPNRSVKVIRGLRAENAEILMVVALLAKELRGLIAMAQMVAEGQQVNAVLKSKRVWPKRQAIVGRCLQRQKVSQLEACLQQLSFVDCKLKGLKPGDPWDELESFALRLAGKPVD